uniref:ATG1a/b/c MIT domain-containing protein n=1 Tax=Lactuca sativa TaxID=4236 RepID=A0A9R1X8M9_LACSA|nr:hypothetical protein LSAT_V11C500291480 [Lactuca sativa]
MLICIVMDSVELIDLDYVLVSGPLGDTSSVASVSKVSQKAFKSGIPPVYSRVNIHSTPSAPLPIIGGTSSKIRLTGRFESQCSASSGTSHGSVDIVDALEKPSTDSMTKIKSLHDCASAISDLVNEKIESGNRIEAFSIQLVILAIWKQALDICHTQAASAIKGSPNLDISTSNKISERERDNTNINECLENAKFPEDVCSHIERIFLGEVETVEELTKVIEPGKNSINF